VGRGTPGKEPSAIHFPSIRRKREEGGEKSGPADGKPRTVSPASERKEERGPLGQIPRFEKGGVVLFTGGERECRRPRDRRKRPSKKKKKVRLSMFARGEGREAVISVLMVLSRNAKKTGVVKGERGGGVTSVLSR